MEIYRIVGADGCAPGMKQQVLAVHGDDGDAVVAALWPFLTAVCMAFVVTAQGERAGFERLVVKTWCMARDANGTLRFHCCPGCSSPWSSAAVAVAGDGAVRSSHGPESFAWENGTDE